ncbi:MAG: hypothetical protein ACD_28C00112G0001 [uncultured bacterium]|nr:MAG: hypothetical protein ACD_28C00112G0001 [uncultured bacterium]KKT74344.1 MAG: hypothetical protein UW70_C0058G0002 [Candidatus Peregrinibacteria bacterium GW2011_GWA2_44_7]
MIGPLFAFGTLLSWSISDLICKVALKQQTLWFVSVWGQLIGGIGIIVLGISLGEIREIPIKSWNWIVLFSALNTLGIFFFYKAIQHKGVALTLPIIYSWSVPTIVLSLIFLNQHPSPLEWMGVGFILMGIFCVGLDTTSKRWMDQGALAALISMLIWGVFYFFIGSPSEAYGEWWIAGSLKIGTALLSFPFLVYEQNSRSSKKEKIFYAVGLIGMLDALGLVALTKAFQESSTAIVTGITSTTPVFVALFGIFIFKERVNRQQALGILSTVAGLILLVI